MKQTTLRPDDFQSNDNISFPVGIAIAVKKYGQKLAFDRIFSPFKKRGIALDRLVQAMITYRLTENESICRASDWINRSHVLHEFNLKQFEERTLFRALEIAGDNHEEIIEYPRRTDYFFFSEQLQRDQIEAKLRMAERKLEEAKEIQRALNKGKPLPRRFLLNNPLVKVTYTYQTRLSELTDAQAKKLVQAAAITGREGFFCLVSSEKLTLKQALEIYRMKDAIEKVFQPLKNDIDIKPLRVWTTKSLCGAILIGFLAQLIISLIRYDYEGLRQVAPKFIKISLMNLTVTIEIVKAAAKRRIFSNFDAINSLICCQNRAIT